MKTIIKEKCCLRCKGLFKNIKDRICHDQSCSCHHSKTESIDEEAFKRDKKRGSEVWKGIDPVEYEKGKRSELTVEVEAWEEKLAERFDFMINAGIEDKLWTEKERVAFKQVEKSIREDISDYTEKIVERIKNLITDEMLIARHDGQSTSRLTSLYNKI